MASDLQNPLLRGQRATWYERATESAHRIEPTHTAPWKLASSYALLSIAESLLAHDEPVPVQESKRDLLTSAEVAEMTRLPLATLRWWRHTGEAGPKSFKLGRRVMYRRADVEQWLAEAGNR